MLGEAWGSGSPMLGLGMTPGGKLGPTVGPAGACCTPAAPAPRLPAGRAVGKVARQ